MSFNAKDMTQGGQIASMRIRMFSQIANIMLYCLFIFFWILVGLVLWVKISWQTFVNGCIYWWCTTLEGMRDLIKSQPVYEIQYYGKTFRMNAAQVSGILKSRTSVCTARSGPVSRKLSVVWPTTPVSAVIWW